MKANYDKIFDEILNTVNHGSTAENVMGVLKRNGLVEGKPTKKRMWLFNFNGGGWNSVMAVTHNEAVEAVKKEYGGSPSLVPLLDSVRPSTEGDYQTQMRNFD